MPTTLPSIPSSESVHLLGKRRSRGVSPGNGGISEEDDEYDDQQETSSKGCGAWRRQHSPCSVLSAASSGRLYAEPAQTLIFLDWDDTIFPCTEIFSTRNYSRRTREWTKFLGTFWSDVSYVFSVKNNFCFFSDIQAVQFERDQFSRSSNNTFTFHVDLKSLHSKKTLGNNEGFPQVFLVRPLPPDLDAELEPWRQAAADFLQAACAISDRCVILTNSRMPWVSACIDHFAPNLKEIFESKNGPRVVYASEFMKMKSRSDIASEQAEGLIIKMLQSSFGQCFDFSKLIESMNAMRQNAPKPYFNLTEAKFKAMRSEATSFYSQYQGQTWKNIISNLLLASVRQCFFYFFPISSDFLLIPSNGRHVNSHQV